MADKVVEPKDRHKVKYDPKYDDIAYEACRIHGCTNVELAEIFHVNVNTIVQWCKDYEEFGRKVRAGKDSFDTNNVEQKLLERALGYTVTETGFNKKGEPQTYEKEIIPDTTAIRFWLTNRQPERWREVRNVSLDMSKELIRNVFVVPGVADFDNAVEEIRKGVEG